MENQISFNNEVIDNLSTLHISYENTKSSMTIEEIFDTKKYNKLRAVTYSVSPRFLNKYLIDFEDVEIVVGINEDRVQAGANEVANNIKAKILSSISNEAIKYYENLDISFKNKLNEKTFDIKVPLGYTIHSKFYLLENTFSGENRVIIGSANLSENAFSDESYQFENIIIYDNSPLFDIQNDLYNSYQKYLTNYFPKDLYQINSKNLKISDNVNSVIFLSNDDVDQIQKSSIIDDIEDVKDKIALAILPADTLNQMKNIDLGREEIKSDKNQEIKYEETAFHIVKDAINTRTAQPKIKEKASIKKLVETNIKPLKVKVSENAHQRDALYSKLDLRNTDAHRSGLLIKSKVNDTYINFGEYADLDVLRSGLIQIDEFIKTFEKYSTKYTDEYGQRIMEVILYSFSAPFLYEIKKLARTNEERLDVPQFLFIGGAAGSGKSSLIKMISKMLGVSEIPYHNYADLGVGHRAKSERKNTLEAWASEENVYPIIVDELPIEFFSNQNYGKSLIMNLANSNVLTVEPFPPIIATTNADSYTLPPEARRRSYYLKIDKVFSDDFRKDSPLAYIKVYENMDSRLFKDFIMQMAKRLENKEEYEWNHFSDGVSKVDFLYQSREIFREYYSICQMPLPRYFPDKRYTDDYETNQEKWKKLYKRAGDEYFKFDPVSGHLFFNIKLLDENVKGYGINESEIYKQGLDQRVVVGSLTGIDIELDTREFFNWINIDNPYKTYYKDIIRDYYINNKKSISSDKDFIYFPIGDLSAIDEEIITIYEWISGDIDVDKNEENFIFPRAEFYSWMGLEGNNNFFRRLFS